MPTLNKEIVWKLPDLSESQNNISNFLKCHTLTLRNCFSKGPHWSVKLLFFFCTDIRDAILGFYLLSDLSAFEMIYASMFDIKIRIFEISEILFFIKFLLHPKILDICTAWFGVFSKLFIPTKSPFQSVLQIIFLEGLRYVYKWPESIKIISILLFGKGVPHVDTCSMSDSHL